MKRNFIRVAEIWTPSRDRSVLEFNSGLYGDSIDFRAVSEKVCFGYDQGLPGKAWADRHPVVLRDLQNSYFMRAAAARDAGLTCGVAIPIFAGDFLMAVVVLFCGDDADNVGAIELWHNDPHDDAGMHFVEGYFGIAQSFEFSAMHKTYMRGFGLPGLVWENGLPQLLSDLGNAHHALGNDDARKVGINKGLGVPSKYVQGQHYVLTFLSALGTPIAQRFEIWVPDARRSCLLFQDGICERDGDLNASYDGVHIGSGHGLLGQVLASGLPVVSDHIHDERSPVGASAALAHLKEVMAFPVLEAGRVTAVVAMYF